MRGATNGSRGIDIDLLLVVSGREELLPVEGQSRALEAEVLSEAFSDRRDTRVCDGDATVVVSETRTEGAI